MNVELLLVADCPHAPAAAALLRRALDDLGLRDLVYSTTTITTEEQAAERGFAGSPSFHVDGTDLFPLPGNPTALACRLYPTASGRAGTPDLADLRSALARGDNTPQG
jgi:hypothetical protein